jgi:FkbM family methyltransferase
MEPMAKRDAASEQGASTMDEIVKRYLRRLLARSPKMYLKILKVLHRGSDEKRLYLSVIKKGDVVFDIGANIGYFTMLFSDLVGPRGTIHAFEPVLPTFQRLCDNLSGIPGYKNVVLNCLAVGDRNGQAQMFVPGDDYGQAALARHSKGSWKSKPAIPVDVGMIRLDDYAKRLSRIDFVKADVEGAELLILRGGESTLRRFRPNIFLETNPQWIRTFGWSSKELIGALRQIGYAYFYGLDADLKRLEETDLPASGVLCTWERVRELA